MNRSDKIDIALLLLRITFGGAIIYGHGWAKLMKLLNESPIQFADPIGLGPEVSLVLAVFAEVLCGLLVVVGLFTRWATIPLIVTMLVAIFVVNFNNPFSSMEKAILFLVPFVSLLLAGPGWYSLDAWWRNRP